MKVRREQGDVRRPQKEEGQAHDPGSDLSVQPDLLCHPRQACDQGSRDLLHHFRTALCSAGLYSRDRGLLLLSTFMTGWVTCLPCGRQPSPNMTLPSTGWDTSPARKQTGLELCSKQRPVAEWTCQFQGKGIGPSTLTLEPARVGGGHCRLSHWGCVCAHTCTCDLTKTTAWT